MAKGTPNGGYAKGKISVTLGWEIFNAVNAISERDGVSFSAALRDLLNKQLKLT